MPRMTFVVLVSKTLLLLLVSTAWVDAGCFGPEALVPIGTVTRCPCFLQDTDVTQDCVVSEHDASTGSGEVRCLVQPTCYEDCPGIHCRLLWHVNRTAEGRHRVVVKATSNPLRHCSLYPYNAVHTSPESCSELFDATPCQDTDEVVDGRVLFGSNSVHACTCTGGNCTAAFAARIQVNVVKNDSGSIALPVAVTIGGLLGMLFGVFLAVIAYRQWHMKKAYVKAPQSTEKVELLSFGNPADVKLEQTLARGRFGIVWCGTSQGERLAVKVTSEKNRDSWVNECQLLSKAFMRHSSIVRFYFGEEKVTSYGVKELWLVMELFPLGSLCSYLRSNKLAWNESVDLMWSLAVGIDYLHSDDGMAKPQIAHRDLKSSNILVKQQPQLRCVLADFGLAAALGQDMDTAALLHQAGTPRYMAPECLASSVDFKDTNSFLKVDMYALGLLLWEISTCSSDFSIDGEVRGHELPYWREVGDQPSIRTMQDVVINHQKRPVLPKTWELAMTSVKELKALAGLFEDIWANEPEERVFSATVMSHLKVLRQQKAETQLAIKPAVALAKKSASENAVSTTTATTATEYISPRAKLELLCAGEATDDTLRDDTVEITPQVVTSKGIGFDSAIAMSTTDSVSECRPPRLDVAAKVGGVLADSVSGYNTGSEQL